MATGVWWTGSAAACTLGPLVDAHRMAEDYAETMYRPALGLARELAADGHSGASGLAAFLGRARSGWDSFARARCAPTSEPATWVRCATSRWRSTAGRSSRRRSGAAAAGRHLGAGGELDEPEIAQMEVDAAGAAVTHGPRTYRARARLGTGTHGSGR
ncbi:MAG: hypothetical protein R2716_08000 [Microthrixaceae bacterium]